MDKSALEETGKQAIIDIELKADVINPLLPQLTADQRAQLKIVLTDMSPYPDNAALLLAEKLTKEGTENG